METTAKCVSMGPAHCRIRLSWCSAGTFQRVHSHAGGSRTGSGNGTRREHSLEEGGHWGGLSSWQRVRVLQPYFIVPGKDGGLPPILHRSQLNRSVMRLKFRMLSSIRSCVSDQIRGLVIHERSKRCIFPISILPHHRKYLRCASVAKRINIGFFPLTLHSHPVLSRSVWILRWLLCDSRASAYSTTSTVVDISSSEWMASRWRSCSHKRDGIKT